MFANLCLEIIHEYDSKYENQIQCFWIRNIAYVYDIWAFLDQHDKVFIEDWRKSSGPLGEIAVLTESFLVTITNMLNHIYVY